VGVEPIDRNNVIVKEEFAAVSATIQNMLLTAHAFGLSKQGEMAAFIYLGYPEMEPRPVKKTDFKDVTTWIDWYYTMILIREGNYTC